MGEYNDSVMVALLPTTTYWCHQELPHVTLIYAGEIPDLKPGIRNDLAKQTISIAQDFGPFSVNVTDTDVFGTNDLVDVMKLELTPELRAMRSQLEQWNGSEHTDYKPHATIGPVGSPIENLPSRLTFDRIVFKWGDATLISDLF